MIAQRGLWQEGLIQEVARNSLIGEIYIKILILMLSLRGNDREH